MTMQVPLRFRSSCQKGHDETRSEAGCGTPSPADQVWQVEVGFAQSECDGREVGQPEGCRSGVGQEKFDGEKFDQDEFE